MTDLKSVANIGVRVQISPFAPYGNVTQMARGNCVAGSSPVVSNTYLLYLEVFALIDGRYKH